MTSEQAGLRRRVCSLEELLELLDCAMYSAAILLIAVAVFLLGVPVRAGVDEKLSGSNTKTEDIALECNELFIAEVRSVSAPTLLGPTQPGVSSYKVDVVVSQQFIGSVPSRLPVTMFTYDIVGSNGWPDLFEHPPKVGSSYIIFAMGYKGQSTDCKILPATDENVLAVRKMLTSALGSPLGGEWNKLTGSTLKVETAVAKSDAIFVGEVTGIGSEVILPPDAMYAGPLWRGIKVKVSQVISGSLGDNISLSMYVLTMRHEQLHKAGQHFLFFVQTKGEAAADYPYDCLEKADTKNIAIKLLSPTDDNIAMVEQVISEHPKK